MQILSRVSMRCKCHAERDIVMTFLLPISLSVCLSVCLRHVVVCFGHIVIFPHKAGPALLIFFSPTGIIKFQWNSLIAGVKHTDGRKICDFRPKSLFISETVQHYHTIATMEH